MKIRDKLKIRFSVLVFIGLFFFCIPVQYVMARTEVTARIAPISPETADSNETESSKNSTEGNTSKVNDKKSVGTGDYEMWRHLVFVLTALSVSFIAILVLKYYKDQN